MTRITTELRQESRLGGCLLNPGALNLGITGVFPDALGHQCSDQERAELPAVQLVQELGFALLGGERRMDGIGREAGPVEV